MGNYIFNREKEEEKIHKTSILDKKKKDYLNWVYTGLLIFGTFIGIIISGRSILLIDGGITIDYIIVQISLSVYDKIVENYMKYIPNSKKRVSNFKYINFIKQF